MKNLTESEKAFDFKVNDSKEALPPGVIAQIEGYATFTGKVNRNNRFYPDGFWEKVLADPEIQEMLDTKTFYGAAKHPGAMDSPYVDPPTVSHAISSYKVDSKGVYVYIDVLDTPMGRAIKPMIDYKSKIGISTRAFGEQKEDSQGRLVPVEGQLIS